MCECCSPGDSQSSPLILENEPRPPSWIFNLWARGWPLHRHLAYDVLLQWFSAVYYFITITDIIGFYSLYVKSCADLKLYTRLMFKTLLTWLTWYLIFLLLVSTETQKHAHFSFGPFPSFQWHIIINIMQNVVYLLRSHVVSGAPSGHNYVRISIYFWQFRLFLCLHYDFEADGSYLLLFFSCRTVGLQSQLDTQ